ncbi:Peptidase family U32 [Succiniclasticum ruminis]|uniref:Peptidase family U32 n=1 Tax=Succiniclasticum ruminis TaxID=40841 RepID=A0A1G6LLX4_9FIRM|nr:U32 family peptidase [Succiniclasticum ruminis]SDC44243.1 Peptidase family U32 [Succiniclasticum ruminis]
MKANRRMYSLPYNGTNPEWFLQEAEKRKNNIDHVYCELPLTESNMFSHVRFLFDGKKNTGSKQKANPDPEKTNLKRANYVKNCAEFLRISKGKVRRICPVNAMYYRYDTEEELKDFVISLARAANYYQLEGFILSDYRMAVLLHALLPELEIHTSCNAYQWNLRQMEIWRDKCGVKVFNPPREILRVPENLKKMHDKGYKLKCLINEGCLMGCPNSFNHNLSIAMSCSAPILSCCQNGIADLFRANWILPRWQKYYDEYVDIYKIAGRNSEGDYPFKCMDAYLTENNDMSLSELMISGTIMFAHRMLPKEILQKITIDKVPDKLLSCECSSCEQCKLCQTILAELIPEEYHSRFVFKVNVEK